MKYVSYDICMSEKAPFYIRNGAFSFLFDKSIRGQKCNIFLQDFSPNMFEHVHHQLQNVTSKSNMFEHVNLTSSTFSKMLFHVGRNLRKLALKIFLSAIVMTYLIQHYHLQILSYNKKSNIENETYSSIIRILIDE